MIYGYGLWKEIELCLQKDFPDKKIRNLQKYNKVKQLLVKNVIKTDDLFFFLRFSSGDQKLQKELKEKGYQLYPNPHFSAFIQHREEYLAEIDTWSKYPLKRVFLPNTNQNLQSVINTHFPNQHVVLKVGNLHASEGKWLIDEKRILPHLKYSMRQLPVTLEEFVPNARSIRIGIVGEPNKEENIYITEHINHKTWLKNHAPDEENTYSYNDRKKLGISPIDELIHETKEIALRYNANLIGVDWVVSKEKTGLLEVNDMIGLPDGNFALELFYKEIKSLCEKHVNSVKAN